MRKLAWLIGVAALCGSAGYLFVYVARWQWNRALFAGFAMITTLVVMGIAMVLRKLSDLETRLDDRPTGTPDAAFLDDLRATRPRRDHFAWLRDSLDRPSVFITMLLGGGAIVSAAAWVVGRVAESTTSPAAEGALAERMGPLAFPADGLRPSSDPASDEVSSLLRGPGASP